MEIVIEVFKGEIKNTIMFSANQQKKFLLNLELLIMKLINNENEKISTNN